MVAIDIKTDRAGFPLIRVDAIGGYLHWLPVTKIQFEHFICDAADRSFDNGWYETLLGLNPRVSPSRISIANYWQALLSGVLPNEAQRYAFWCGDGFRLPTLAEWQLAYSELSARPPLLDHEIRGLGLWQETGPRGQRLFEQLESASGKAAQTLGYERRLSDQMLMRLGVVEWVKAEERWGGMGEPYPAFWGNLLTPALGSALLTNHAESERLPALGFRLVWTPQALEGRE